MPGLRTAIVPEGVPGTKHEERTMEPGQLAVVVVVAVIVAVVAWAGGWVSAAARARLGERRIREDAARRQRAVVGGQVSEQLAPYLPGFPFSPSEARFIGKPVDLLVFVGMDGKRIEKIVFVEVKTGKARLSDQERQIREAVEAGRVEWFTYRR
jgi:hypothetical protein